MQRAYDNSGVRFDDAQYFERTAIHDDTDNLEMEIMQESGADKKIFYGFGF